MLQVIIFPMNTRNEIVQARGRGKIVFDVMVDTKLGNGFTRNHLMTWSELFKALRTETREVRVVLE